MMIEIRDATAEIKNEIQGLVLETLNGIHSEIGKGTCTILFLIHT